MKNVQNRMASALTRTGENAPQPAKVVEIQIKRQALQCPCCGRGAMARVYKTEGPKKYLQCEGCGGKYVAAYDSAGKPVTVRRI